LYENSLKFTYFIAFNWYYGGFFMGSIANYYYYYIKFIKKK
jgi:hypothetical protein